MTEQDELVITINGKTRGFPKVLTLDGLLIHLGLPTKSGIAVERNKQIVPKSEYAGTRLESGDVLEIVTLVGGG